MPDLPLADHRLQRRVMAACAASNEPRAASAAASRARGELFEYDRYSSALTVSRPDGTSLFSEKLVVEPWRYPVRYAGMMGGFDVFANVILVTPPRHAATIFEQVASGADAAAGCMAGASRLPNDAGLSYKVLGTQTQPVKAKVRAFWDLTRREVTGAPAPASRTWG